MRARAGRNGRNAKIFPPPQRVAVLRALQVGDLLCAVPALRALRSSLPEARIVLIGLPWARWFVQRFASYLDDFLELPGFPGLPEREFDHEMFPAFLAEAHAHRFDLVLQMHGSGALTNPLAALLGAERVAGYHEPGSFCPDPSLFLETVRGPEPEVRRWVRLVEHVGYRSCGEDLEFPVWEKDRLELRRRLGSSESSAFICVHPGGRSAERRWPADRFAEVADRISGWGFPIVLTGGPGEEEIGREVAARMRAPALDTIGKLSLGGLAALVERAALVVCNDTSVSHIAAALRVPSVVITVASDPGRWAPLDTQRHRIVDGPREDATERVLQEAEYGISGGGIELKFS
ncbi:MAG: glycosyltransferase family 9 protein [Candidatus Eisenbacteria bacterium]